MTQTARLSASSSGGENPCSLSLLFLSLIVERAQISIAQSLQDWIEAFSA